MSIAGPFERLLSKRGGSSSSRCIGRPENAPRGAPPYSDAVQPEPRGDTTMRFMIMVKSAENAGPPPNSLMTAIAKLGEEAMRAGVMVQMGGLLPSAMGARVRLSAGKLTVSDGPFTETKELIAGYAVYNVMSKQEAIEWSSRFMALHQEHWPGWEGEAEIRQIFDPQDLGSGDKKK